jgi:hypothetical protein
MAWGVFFANQDDDREEGFKDPGSNISYTNESVQDTLNQAAWFEEYGSGSDIRTTDGRSPSECGDDARFNTTILEVDDEGHYYPARHSPGK